MTIKSMGLEPVGYGSCELISLAQVWRCVRVRRRLWLWKTYFLIDRVQSAEQRRRSRAGIRLAWRLAESIKSVAKRNRAKT